MPQSNPFTGTVVVIDDEINDPTASISNLISQIEDQHIPIAKYSELPNFQSIEHFRSLSFLLLDWQLAPDLNNGDATPIAVPSELREAMEQANTDFLKALRESVFCPVFIFTNHVIDDVKAVLSEAGLFEESKPDRFFIESKSVLSTGKLFDRIQEWLMSNPSMHVLSVWDRGYTSSKNSMFSDFYSYSPHWPRIFWEAIAEDSASQPQGLTELLTRNLTSRMGPLAFSEGAINCDGTPIDPEEITAILERERFLEKTSLHDDNIEPGDIFKIGKYYYINIRAACDLIRDRRNSNSSLDDVTLYLIRGQKLSNNQLSNLYDSNYGYLKDGDTSGTIFPIVKGKAITFQFKELSQKTWREVSSNRIGRLLPPHITRIQEKYVSYLRRTALPRLPSEAIPTQPTSDPDQQDSTAGS